MKLPKFDFNPQLILRKLYEKYFVPMSEADKQKMVAYFYIALTLASVSFFGLAAIGPTLNTVSNLNKQYADNMLVLDALNTKLTNLKTLDSEYQSLESSLDLIYAAIPKNVQVPKLTRQLENIAAARNVQVTQLVVNTVEIFPNIKKDPIFSFLFSINVAGNETDVNNFVADIINFDRIVGVERVSTGKDQQGKYTVSITGRVFFAKQ